MARPVTETRVLASRLRARYESTGLLALRGARDPRPGGVESFLDTSCARWERLADWISSHLKDLSVPNAAEAAAAGSHREQGRARDETARSGGRPPRAAFAGRREHLREAKRAASCEEKTCRGGRRSAGETSRRGARAAAQPVADEAARSLESRAEAADIPVEPRPRSAGEGSGGPAWVATAGGAHLAGAPADGPARTARPWAPGRGDTDDKAHPGATDLPQAAVRAERLPPVPARMPRAGIREEVFPAGVAPLSPALERGSADRRIEKALEEWALRRF